MATQDYKGVNNHANEISGCTIISRLLYARAPHIGGMNGDIQSDLATLVFKNGEQLEDFHRIMIRLQQKMILSGELYILKDFSSSTRRNFKREKRSKHSLYPGINSDVQSDLATL